MSLLGNKDLFDKVFSEKNWEDDIAQVLVESCDRSVDPLGYRAVFYQHEPMVKPAFVIGASFLKQRHENLMRTGYAAPMTERAINLIEHKLGRLLSGVET
ncbi:MAG: hypothetical protein KTR28_06960 [Micavibrio sp.]|nr:hypothetical protein [Micavibrio sp.]